MTVYTGTPDLMDAKFGADLAKIKIKNWDQSAKSESCLFYSESE